MPRYYFNVRDGDDLEVDLDGGVFPDIKRAREEALVASREIMAEKVMNGELLDGQAFEITTETGEVVEVVKFRSALKLK